MNTKKQQLEKELEEIKRLEEKERKEKEKEKNYEMFLKRNDDWVIGKAHCDIGITKIDHDWYNGRYFTIGNAISIHGNCGTSYNAKAPITSSTHTFFHNVWTDKQRKSFQDKLDKVALKEITKIMNTLRNKLEILGLQSDSFFLSTIYPQKRVEEIRKEVWNETKKVLNKHTDKEFTDLIKIQKGLVDSETNEKISEFYDIDLSHSKSILFKYIIEKRKKLHKRYSKIDKFNELLNRSSIINQ